MITVGAERPRTAPRDRGDDFAAPWSAYGYTLDGFAKPDIGAPGRYLTGPVPATSTMALERPERVTAAGYMWMSGTSFAAPVVAGAAAQLLATSRVGLPTRSRAPSCSPQGQRPPGQRSASAKSTLKGAYSFDYGTWPAGTPPNPNAALGQYVVADGAGALAFDSASWSNTATADASWNQASWTRPRGTRHAGPTPPGTRPAGTRLPGAQASWASASWNAASWAAASWAAASLECGQLGSRFLGPVGGAAHPGR